MPAKKPSEFYEPFVKVGDISSLGRSHRVFGHKSGRTHHLLSDLELSVFLLLEWNANVISINEQVELNLAETLIIAEEAKIKHPNVRGENNVMTSDFHVFLNSKNKSISTQMALQVKYTKDLDDPRTIEKIEIEKRFWKSKDVPFYIITENEIPKIISNNIKWLYPARNTNSVNLSFSDYEYYSKQLLKHSSLKLIEFCKKCDTANDAEMGKTLSYIKAFLAHNFMSFDITKDYRKMLCSEVVMVKQEHYELIIEEMKVA